MATIELANLGFRFENPLPTFSRRNRSALRFVSRDGRIGRRIISCSVVDEQVGVSFTGEENKLIEAIVGIQGRGRSASPQQLQVQISQFKYFDILSLHFIYYFLCVCISLLVNSVSCC